MAKSSPKVLILLIQALSELELWLGCETIELKSLDNNVRPAIVTKSKFTVLILLTTALSDVSL